MSNKFVTMDEEFSKLLTESLGDKADVTENQLKSSFKEKGITDFKLVESENGVIEVVRILKG
jgi:hypothetical protein